ncbi:hypothetical protein FIBSPDRAFT_962008 [Athelia psychrophila]|uniref:Uncharacterized protein n=1 Tax=Athelia psychrophila TaxID=1759441 RepID=A0A166ALG2_9AGAM|nr:hypothetical protein FIBSPDRAFT_962008 [Fibularhizoctonia sp. CBS 109695]
MNGHGECLVPHASWLAPFRSADNEKGIETIKIGNAPRLGAALRERHAADQGHRGEAAAVRVVEAQGGTEAGAGAPTALGELERQRRERQLHAPGHSAHSASGCTDNDDNDTRDYGAADAIAAARPTLAPPTYARADARSPHQPTFAPSHVRADLLARSRVQRRTAGTRSTAPTYPLCVRHPTARAYHAPPAAAAATPELRASATPPPNFGADAATAGALAATHGRTFHACPHPLAPAASCKPPTRRYTGLVHPCADVQLSAQRTHSATKGAAAGADD